VLYSSTCHRCCSPCSKARPAFPDYSACHRRRVVRRRHVCCMNWTVRLSSQSSCPSMVCSDCWTVLPVVMSPANKGVLSMSSRCPDILFADGCKLYHADSDHCVNCKSTLCETICCIFCEYYSLYMVSVSVLILLSPRIIPIA